MLKLLVVMVLGASGAPAWSAPRTVTLSVPTMDCPVCPITVKKALVKVTVVSLVKVIFEMRQATVTFDDAKTSGESLTRATTDAGYPSTLAGREK